MLAFLDRFNISLGSWFGIPVTLHWTWLMAFTLSFFGGTTFVGLFVGLFLIVLLHEFGHCFAAKMYGRDVADIKLTILGGIARLQLPENPRQEIVVALAGPAVNVALIPVLGALGLFVAHFFILLSLYNIVILLFNLVPAFPMDGGRVLRALLTMWFGNRTKATLWATRIGQGFCVLMAICGLLIPNITLVFVAGFIAMSGQREYDMVKGNAQVAAADARAQGIAAAQRIIADAQRAHQQQVNRQNNLS